MFNYHSKWSFDHYFLDEPSQYAFGSTQFALCKRREVQKRIRSFHSIKCVAFLSLENMDDFQSTFYGILINQFTNNPMLNVCCRTFFSSNFTSISNISLALTRNMTKFRVKEITKKNNLLWLMFNVCETYFCFTATNWTGTNRSSFIETCQNLWHTSCEQNCDEREKLMNWNRRIFIEREKGTEREKKTNKNNKLGSLCQVSERGDTGKNMCSKKTTTIFLFASPKRFLW